MDSKQTGEKLIIYIYWDK